MYRIFGKPRSFTCAAISAVVVFGLTGCAASSQLALTAKGDDGTLVADPGLQECLKANKIETAADAAKATKMDCFDYKIKDLTGIEQLTHLTYLDMDMNEFSDLTPLSTLTKLEHLCLMGSRISDVSALSGLVNLKELDLDETAVADLTPLKALSKLETLYARNTKVADVTPLAGLKHLKQVYLNGSEVRSVAPLKPQIKNGAHVLYDWYFGAPFTLNLTVDWKNAPNGAKTEIGIESPANDPKEYADYAIAGKSGNSVTMKFGQVASIAGSHWFEDAPESYSDLMKPDEYRSELRCDVPLTIIDASDDYFWMNAWWVYLPNSAAVKAIQANNNEINCTLTNTHLK